MLFSNLTLQWCGDLQQTFAEFRRVLKPGGLLLFTTLGPDTLKELRESWRQVDGAVHVNEFIDMHDIGDALVQTKFGDPVMDMEYLTLTYTDSLDLMRDLKVLGAHNVNPGRSSGLTGKGRIKAVQAAYEQFRNDGVLPATYEVIYGHAWRPEQDVQMTKGGTVHIPIDQLKSSS
jgi:malonyl-CoA O-methyltransferase